MGTDPYKPHRAEWARRRWLMRIGDSFVDVPPPVLRSLFFPQRRSYIYLRIAKTRRQQSAGGLQVFYEVTLYNEGPATADNLLLVARNLDNMQIPLDHSRRHWWGGHYADGWHLRSPEPLHPGQMTGCPPIEITYVHDTQDVEFDFQLSTTDQVPCAYKVTVPANSSVPHDVLPEPLTMDRFR